ncbi:MAG: hypothetical protein ABH869_06145 [Candidatus Omnitrophota bacterium]
MRGNFFNRRKRQLNVLAIFIAIFFCAGYFYPRCTKHLAEQKIQDFLEDKIIVDIGGISGGIFNDIVLRDLKCSFLKENTDGFQLGRVEIHYRWWWKFAEMLGFEIKSEGDCLGIRVYFSETNPFFEGFVNLYKYPDKIRVLGYLSPRIFEDIKQRKVAGTLFEKKQGKYEFDFLWNNERNITGTIDMVSRTIEMGLNPLPNKKGEIKVLFELSEEDKICGYIRLDKVDLAGVEVIGDIWADYMFGKDPRVSLKVKNLVVNKRSFWDIAVNGGYNVSENVLVFDEITWGKGIRIKGCVGLTEGFPSDLTLSFKKVSLNDTVKMFGEIRDPLEGLAEGEIKIKGLIKKSDVKGRIYIGQGVMGNMEFRSIFFTLEGQLPVIRVTDSRIVKDAGYILISGEMDFSKMNETKVFENLIFNTDNKVAVWEDWQIEKEKNFDQVEAKKDRLIVTTTLADTDSEKDPSNEVTQKELEFKYEIDTKSSIKLKFEEENDFLGLEHKIKF